MEEAPDTGPTCTCKVVRRPDGTISHLDLATFVFTRIPYDPDAPIPGGGAR